MQAGSIEDPNGSLDVIFSKAKRPETRAFHYLCQQFFTYLAQFSSSLSSDNIKRQYSSLAMHSSQ